MTNKQPRPSDGWRHYFGPNLGYIGAQYDAYARDRESVPPAYRELFDRWGPPPGADAEDGTAVAPRPTARAAAGGSAEPPDDRRLKMAIDAGKLVWNIRAYGHLAANIDPLGLAARPETRMLEPECCGLTQDDLASLPAAAIWEEAPPSVATGWEAFLKLRDIYCGTIAFEFAHVQDEQERNWLNRKAEEAALSPPPNDEERIALLARLVEAEEFERFLHRTFTGQKRFSIEGVDVLVALVNELVHELANDGARRILIGMAHRGRLNVLAHVLGKPYSAIFSEFHHAQSKKLVPSEGSIGINYGWTGDVKYHLGANRSIRTGETAETRLTLANNPSHLEFVNPVVAGFARAAQEERSRPGPPTQRVDAAAPIIMHGDAAFPGEGIVAETLNFNNLAGYANGGTVHIIVNNRIGFTTESTDSRSTQYASDPAKGFEIPIVHVNADDPEACIAAARFAAEYRCKFKKDFLIDLVGYRRYGHNEADDPETTQPLVYAKVNGHPSVSARYAGRLIREGMLTEADEARLREDVLARLKAAYDETRRQDIPAGPQARGGQGGLAGKRLATAVPQERLRRMNADLLRFPDGFNVYPKLQRILERRASALEEGQKLDWGHAETLAFASILADGTPIRLSGQDAQRATFAHRNLVLHDYKSGATHCPLHTLTDAKASFAIYNSPLSEAGVLGFEYGYNVYAPETMVIWEAQYGDFANAAQVAIDQFIAAGRSKWSQPSGLTMLLPHGYEGQGPEHSSARLERYLQLSAEENWTVAYVTSAAQYFHLLRRQAAIIGTESARPLVVMAPKSLIRNPRVASPAAALSEGAFRPLVEHAAADPQRVGRIVLCTGKIAIDLVEAIDKLPEGERADWLHVASVEQLYPLPEADIRALLQRFAGAKEIVWLQEEPMNMGAWRYIEPHLRAWAPASATVDYIGRPDRASPASGYQFVHQAEQQAIVARALRPPSIEDGHLSGGGSDA